MFLIVDLDGVVYRGRQPVPGVAAALARRAAAGDLIVYATNNSRAHRAEYAARLAALGAPVDARRIVTAARATALVLAGDRPRWCASGRTMVLGGPGLGRELRDVGLRVLAPTRHGLAAGPGSLVVGVDFALSYERLSVAAAAVRDGATFVATNRDHVFPTEGGLMAGAGTMVAAVAVAAGREPDLVVGKPEPHLFEAAAALAGRPVREAVVVGDGLRTDIAAARRVGARSILILTGVTSADEVEAADAGDRPTVVAADAAGLERALAALAGDTSREA
ncbi:MAG TPA: HAD-IIA family hydrolase [Candidatus Limnocylindrales bacterium]|nr:HAD-IIA family hydrolase [Candidatus Limnocylindrales bacterium]